MKNSELYRQYRDYNPDEDDNNEGPRIAEAVFKRSGYDFERLHGLIMEIESGKLPLIEKCRDLEREALAESRIHQ